MTTDKQSCTSNHQPTRKYAPTAPICKLEGIVQISTQTSAPVSLELSDAVADAEAVDD